MDYAIISSMKDFRDELLDKFVYYTGFDTMSDPSKVGLRRPTTKGQEVLLKELERELKALSIETTLNDDWALKGLLKGNSKGRTIAFMAHVDTADDVMGNGVKAQVIDYKGGDIRLSSGLIISEKDNPDLRDYVDSKIITSDGNTLLGADDKAGVAIIMSAVKYLVEHPEIKHPDIEVYFTPDEETGAGMDGFDYEKPVVRMDPLFVGYLDGLYAYLLRCSFHFGRGAGHGCRHFVWICGLSALSVCPFEVVACGVIRCFPCLF